MKKAIGLIVVLGLVVAGGFWGWKAWGGGEETAPKFRTVQVSRGDLLATIGATGTVEPEEVIDVGAQVAGQILAFGKDSAGKPIDYGSTVEEGMILAQIDDSLYRMDLAQQKAAVDQAKAGQIRAEADLRQMQAKAEQAARDWERAQKLGPAEALSQASYDAAKAAYDSARATVGVGEAAISQAKANVASAEAGMARAQRNMGYTVIKSPVRGTIIDRRVNIGQTVVSSLNAPSLFLIAKDLKRMQVWIAVNEADIGQIQSGQRVTFSVDSFPGQTFIGQVSKVRLNATMTQNVVTYTVEVTTDNSSGKLLPYLTANAQFEISKRENVLLAPNAALRYVPGQQLITPEARTREENNRPSTRRSTTRPARESNFGKLWVQAPDGLLKPVTVKVGLSDGMNTEVSGDQVQDGMAVVSGEERAESAGGSATASPFTPQMPRGMRRGGR